MRKLAITLAVAAALSGCQSMLPHGEGQEVRFQAMVKVGGKARNMLIAGPGSAIEGAAAGMQGALAGGGSANLAGAGLAGAGIGLIVMGIQNITFDDENIKFSYQDAGCTGFCMVGHQTQKATAEAFFWEPGDILKWRKNGEGDLVLTHKNPNFIEDRKNMFAK